MTSTTIFLFVLSAFVLLSNAFTPTKTYEPRMITIAEPRTVTETERRNKGRSGNRQRDSDPVIPPDQDRNDSPLEWLMDGDAPRGDTDPFHILLMNETFYYSPVTMTVQYVAQSCSYVLGMPIKEAEEHAEFTKVNGLTCLGTWTHKECMKLGRQLQLRDLVVRVVPYCEGGDRFWQARDASDEKSGQAGGFE